MGDEKTEKREMPTLLVAVDFSLCSRLALRKAKELQKLNKGKLAVLHVIDRNFVAQFNRYHLGKDNDVKKKLFLDAKQRLKKLLHDEGLDEKGVRIWVCEGFPCIEINKKANEIDADMVVMGSQGRSGDMKSIFFGSTAERVLRFIIKPVLCVPPEADHRI